MQPYPAVTNCGNTPQRVIEDIRLPESFVQIRPAHSPRLGSSISGAIIEQHLRNFFEIGTVDEVAAFLSEVPAFSVRSSTRPVAVSSPLFLRLEAIAIKSGYPIQDCVSILLASSPAELGAYVSPA